MACTGQVHLNRLSIAGCAFIQLCIRQVGACGLQLTCQDVYSSKDCRHLDGGPSKSRAEEGQWDTCQAWAARQSCMSAEGCKCSMLSWQRSWLSTKH